MIITKREDEATGLPDNHVEIIFLKSTQLWVVDEGVHVNSWDHHDDRILFAEGTRVVLGYYEEVIYGDSYQILGGEHDAMIVPGWIDLLSLNVRVYGSIEILRKGAVTIDGY